MKRLSILLLLFAFIASTTIAQNISDADVIKIAQQEKNKGTKDEEIGSILIRRGATVDQVRRLRAQYSKQIAKTGIENSVDNAISGAENTTRVNNGQTDAASIARPDMVGEKGDETVNANESAEIRRRRIYGHNIFNNSKLTFEPAMNIPTPTDYTLGPGDQLVINIYGATQETLNLTISPDGFITVPDYGPIQVSGLSVENAQARIKSKLGSYYSSSNIKTTLGQTRTIKVNVMGEVRTPGTYSLSAFATVFHALYIAGGINNLGTMRNIKVYRGGKQISVVDVYEFITNGRLAGNVRLADNDVIQVGTYDCIVDIGGHVKRPMAYEIRNGESLSTLLKYCGGLTGDAYSKTIRVLRSKGKMRSVFNVDEFDMANFKLADGDAITIDGIYDRYDNMVEIKGAVFRQGMFELNDKNHSVLTLIEQAEGLTEEAMTSRAVIRRLKPNRTQEVLSLDLQAIIDGREPDVELKNEDILFIPTLAEHQNLRTITIEGEVVFPGTFEYADSTTVEDLIVMAGGLTDAAAMVNVDISRRIWDPKATTSSREIAKTFRVSLKDGLAIEGGSGFKLEPYDIVQVRKSPVYNDPVKVEITGEVSFQGTYTLEKKNQRISDIITAAGGISESAYLRGARLERHMTEEEKARYIEVIKMARQNNNKNDSISLEQVEAPETYTVGIHLDEAIANPGGKYDIELLDGDHIIIPRYNRTVRVSGTVHAPNTVAFIEGKGYKHYVEQAGGFGYRAKKRQAYIVYQNGTIALARKAKVEPGCEIVVPTKGERDLKAATQWAAIGSTVTSTASMLATMIYILTR